MDQNIISTLVSVAFCSIAITWAITINVCQNREFKRQDEEKTRREKVKMESDIYQMQNEIERLKRK